ncbi:MAG: pyruvate, phosphate dikinase, partial [Pseudomonadota bacterium]
MKNLLGGKGANLAEMSNLGLPVPPGFTITTDVCAAYYAAGKVFPRALEQQVDEALDAIGATVGSRFGDTANPLLVSVRSGARASMPGMMDTILNLGLNDDTVEGLAARSGDPRFAWDSYRRFIQMFGDVVLGVDHDMFEGLLDTYKQENGLDQDIDLGADDWREMSGRFRALVEEETGSAFPQDLRAQLWGAISAVFDSWQNARANTYRRLHGIPDDWGTAVNVQAMVFGNLGDTSATGVAFTRNPSTGENALYGEFLVNAQGEDVVAGIRTPQSLTEAARREAGDTAPSFETTIPEAFAAFKVICTKLEAHYRDMQDIEFTVQDGKLWMLQTRAGKRTTEAALRIAVEMAGEGVISEREAVLRVEPEALDQLLHPTLDPDAPREVIGRGLPASPGAASGAIVFTADEAEAAAASGEAVLLVRVETSPEDIHGMHAAVGILTTRGGMTSHAAVVARGMGRPCVSGAGGFLIDQRAGTLSVGGRTFSRGDRLTIDGASGEVLAGDVAMRQPELSGDFATLMSWADAARQLKVRANADTPRDAEQARSFGAEGIGLCRTEHMFFDDARIQAVREMILADHVDGRRAALDKLLPMQRADFKALFEIMGDLPVTIRLLDPPLHEFLPQEDDDIVRVATSLGVEEAALRQRIEALSEFNPMLGFRGCRLAIAYPEIPEMQARAIFEAQAEAAGSKEGLVAAPEIMLPLIVGGAEFRILEAIIRRVADEVSAATGQALPYIIGTMVELPRACLR